MREGRGELVQRTQGQCKGASDVPRDGRLGQAEECQLPDRDRGRLSLQVPQAGPQSRHRL